MVHKEADGNCIVKRILGFELKRYNLLNATRVYSPKYGMNGYDDAGDVRNFV